jgi:hypothetical protein
VTYPPPPPSQPPPYGAPQGGYPARQPDSKLVWAICAVLCCLPFGVVSIIYSSKVSGLWTQGRYAEAQKASEGAEKWAIWGIVAGVVAGIIYAIIVFNSSNAFT